MSNKQTQSLDPFARGVEVFRLKSECIKYGQQTAGQRLCRPQSATYSNMALTSRQVTRPDVAVNLPPALFPLPDHDIFTDVKQFPIPPIECISADLINGFV